MIKWTLLVNRRTHKYTLRVGQWSIPTPDEVILLHGTWTESELRDMLFSQCIKVWFSAQHSVYYISNTGRTNSRHDHVATIPRRAVDWGFNR